MKQKGTFSLKKRQTRIMLYLLMAIIAVTVYFSVAGAWFMDRDGLGSPMEMGGAVIVELTGSGEDGAIQNFKELYDSDGGAYPGDKILDSIKVQMGENTEESVLRVKYSVNILDEEKNVKTEDLTEAETNLVAMLENDLKSKTTLYSSDWAQTSSDWVYYKHLASGKTKPIDLFDEYSLPLPDSQMNNSYQELSFRISLVAEAIQAANILSHEEWNNDITNLSDSALIERIIKYNGERFADVDEVLPYIETSGGQYIDTGYVANLNTAVEVTFQTSSGNKWLFGSRTTGGASNTYAVHVSSMNTIWFQMANDSSSTQFSVGNIKDKQSTLTVNKDAAYLNGTRIGTVGRSSFGDNTLSLYLGVINANGSGTDRPFVGKIYSMRIWDNGELARFFVPARDKDGNVGFFDLVTKQMYLNAGSGSFAYGHSINYIANGGTIDASAPKTFVSSDLPITLPTPTRTGYEFGGWFLSADFSGAAQTTIPAGTDSNVYVYAKWIKTYNIIYHLGGGENAESNPQTFNEKTLPLTLAAPTREGFTFAGWYQNPAYSGNQVTTIDVGTEKNVSLWAKWDAIEYSISYVLNGGENSDQNVTKFTILDTPVKLYNPTYDGYVFEGWFTSNDFSGERMTYLSKDNLENISLYAKWSLAYTITYNTNGGLNDGRNPSVFTENTETFTLYEASKVNYTFLGWFDNEELSGNPITQITKGTKSNIVLWAKWSSTQITVTFDPNGGGVSPVTKLVKKGGTYVELPTPTKAGYTFNGWGFAMPLSVGANTVRQDDYTIKSGASNADTFFWVNQNYHLTIGNQYVVKFYAIVDPNNTWRFAPQNRTPEFSLKNGYNEVAFVAGDSRGFFFDDKNPDPEHPFIITDVIIEAQTEGEVITFSTTKHVNSETQITLESNHTLFAQWTENVYTVTYNLDGGTNAAGNPATFKRSDLPIVLLDATKTGEYFAGWYTDAEFTKRVTKIDAGSLKNVELWARFSSSPLVFDPVGNSAYSVRAANSTISGDIEIPATHNGKPVVVIQNSGFTDCSSLTSISIPNSVKSIGINAFENCSNITEIVIPEGVTLVANNTFLGCVKLASVTLPTSLESIGANAFSGCTSMTTIVLQKNIEEIGANAFANCSRLDIVEVFGDTPATLKTGVFPDSVSKIYVKPSLVATYKAAWSEYKDKIVGFTEYNITYNLDGGINNEKNVSSFTKIDLPITLYNPTKENADFLGWYTTSDFSGEKVTEIATAANITLYARWDRKMTITYVLNGGRNNAANLSTITENMLPYSLGDPTSDDMLFEGWYFDAGFKNLANKIETFGDVTVYAKWGQGSIEVLEFIKLDNGNYSVKAKSGATLSGTIKIPAKYDGKIVEKIADSGFYNLTGITEIVFGSNITEIGSSAFYGCTGLVSVKLPTKLTSIGGQAFSGCSSLESIYIPSSVNNINNDAFRSCSNLSRVEITNLSSWFKITFSSDYANPLNNTNACMYLNDKKTLSVSIPKSITELKKYSCYGFNYVFIPKNVVTIPGERYNGSAFDGDDTIEIYCEHESRPNGWGYYWNYKNNGVISTIWGVSGLPVETSEWRYVEKINGSILIIKYLGSDIDVVIPSTLDGKSVSELYEKCFSGKSAITSITIPNSITSIDSYAFSSCNGLTKVNITDIAGWFRIAFGNDVSNPLYYAHHLYLNGTELTEITIPNTITKINEYALYGASAITAITTPSGLTSIGSYAFYDCTSMTKIFIPKGVTTLSASSYSASPFYGWNSSAVIYCEASSKPSGWGEYWNFYDSSNRLATIWNVAGLPQQNSDWVYVAKNDGTIGLVKYLGAAIEVTVPSTLSSKTVSEICGNCFASNSAITSIAIPNSVTSIGSSAFSGCSNLSKVNISDLASWLKISFADGNSNPLYYAHHLYLNNSELTEITVPSSITTIKSYAFYGASAIKRIYIPSSVTTITASAGSYSPFYGWNSSAVIYCGAASRPSEWGWSWNYYGSGYLTTIWNMSGFGSRNAEWEYVIENGETSIIRYIGTATVADIPSALENKPVTYIYEGCFQGNNTVTSITIPSGVKTIARGALSGCGALNKLTIPFVGGTLTSDSYLGYVFGASSYSNNSSYVPSSLKILVVTGGETIANYAFSDCNGLTSITIPNSVTEIGRAAFQKCVSLDTLTIPFVGASSNSSYSTYLGYVFGATSYSSNSTYVPSSLKTIVVTGGVSIGKYAFYDCRNITSITIPSSVTSIGYSAFQGCIGLTSIMIPSKVTSIGDYAFSGCNRLTSIIIPEGVKTIGYRTFYNCSKLTSITIPSSVTSIGVYVLSGCSALNTLTIPFVGASSSSNNYLGYLFGASSYSSNATYVPTSLKKVILTAGTSIASYAFYNCSKLTSITIPIGVTSIGERAFSGCSSLTSINIPDGVISIGGSAFSGCSGLTSITIPDSVTSIAQYAFYGCSSLKTLTTPFVGRCLGYIFGASSYSDNFTYVPSSLKTVVVTGGTSIESYAFYNCSKLTSISLPDEVASIGESAFYNCSGLTSISLPDGVTSVGGSAFERCSGLTSITIPNKVTTIGDRTFFYCSGLTSITIPDGVTSIGDLAFDGCSGLTSIVVPSGVTSIGKSAFSGCSGLTSIALPDGVTSIGEWAFSGCSSLTSITIPNGVTSIGDYAFSGCTGLTSITISSSVNKIGRYAFNNCSGLTSITFEDASGWYRTKSSDYTGGTATNLSTPATNATYFKSTYYSYYWYKSST